MKGEIFVNGTPITQMSNNEIVASVSYSNENVSTFTGTVIENIALFREFNQCNVGNVINAAHMELDVHKAIDDASNNISSGERRRIEIARSLMNPYSVLIFDEVTSTLDIETAFEIERMVLGYSDKTVIFISHNFSGKLVREYDDILIIDKGCLVAHGKYDDLINQNKYFRNICEVKFGRIV